MTEEPVETATIQVSVRETVTYKKIKNARVALVQNNVECFVGTTEYNGTLYFENVPYGNYTVNITRSGYEDYANNLNVNSSSVFVPPFLTPLPVDPNFIEVDLDETYEFTISGKTHPNYQCCAAIIDWIKSNLESLTDDYNKPLFSKVNYGYNSETLKGFGKKPVADVYIDTLGYSTDFDDNKPETVNSFIICYLKGNMNNAYLNACELTDFLIQQFEENNDFREFETIVRNTSVSDVQLQIIPNGKTYGVLCAFELQHKLY